MRKLLAKIGSFTFICAAAVIAASAIVTFISYTAVILRRWTTL